VTEREASTDERSSAVHEPLEPLEILRLIIFGCDIVSTRFSGSLVKLTLDILGRVSEMGSRDACRLGRVIQRR